MSYVFAPGATSKSIHVQIVDDTGLPVDGLVAATFPATYYQLAGANAGVQITLSDLATITTAWASGGVKEIDATNQKGWYRLDVPDAALATAGHVQITGEATNKRLINGGIFIDHRLPDALSGTVGSGLALAGGEMALVDSAITAAKIAADAFIASKFASDVWVEARTAINGGDYALSTDVNGRIRIVDGTGAGELDTNGGKVLLAATQVFDNTGTWTGNISGSVGSISGVTFPSNFSLLGINASGHISRVVLVDTLTTYTGNTPQTGDSFARIGANGSGLTAVDDATLAAIAALSIPTATQIRDAVTGGAYALDTDANGRIRIVDGTGAGELDTASGLVKISGTLQTLDALDTSLKTDNDVTQASIAALNNISTAQVLAQVEAALATTTRALPGQVTPSTTPTLADAIMQIFQQSTNPYEQDSSAQRLYNRAGTVVHQKRTVADAAGILSYGALVTGP